MLRYKASTDFLVIGDEEEGLGLRGTLGLHLLEAEVVVHHLPDLLHLTNSILRTKKDIPCVSFTVIIYISTNKIHYNSFSRALLSSDPDQL